MTYVALLMIILCLSIFVFNLLSGILYLKKYPKFINKKLISIEGKYRIENKEKYLNSLGYYRLTFSFIWLLGSMIAFYMDITKIKYSSLIVLIIIFINYVIRNIFEKNISCLLKKRELQ